MANAPVEALERLRRTLVDAPLHLEVAGVEEARRARRALVDQIDDHLLPRLRRLDAPLLVVVGGSTGAGKSTLVNSVVGAPVSPSGVLRPTTRSPVLVCHPDDLEAFADDRVLPALARDTGRVAGDGRGLQVLADPRVPAGLALVDAPDVDSVVTANRELAAQLLGAADLWLFTTTAARYADAVPWDVLGAAVDRGTSLAVVLDRVPPEARGEVAAHLRAMLDERGLERAPLFTVPEVALEGGLLPDAAVGDLRAWLTGLAADAEARARVVRSTLEGALDSLGDRVAVVAAEVEAQAAAAAALAADVDRAYTGARDDVVDGLASGTLLRREVLARWHDVVGTGDLLRSLESRVGRARDRVKAALTGRPAQARELQAALGGSVEALVVGAADRAADRAASSWRSLPAGRALVGERRLDRCSPELPAAVGDEIRGWQGRVLDLVGDEGASKRAVARALSLGVNTAGVALMVVVFANTGGLTGGEVAVAGGTATVSQALLEAVFGDQAVRRLTSAARDDLLARVDVLLGGEAERFHALLAPLAPPPAAAEAVRRAAAGVQAARR